LDPAGKYFSDKAAAERLDKAHATFVQVTHTDDTGYGWAGSHGTVDIYINGGGPQPGVAGLTGTIDTVLTEGSEFWGNFANIQMCSLYQNICSMYNTYTKKSIFYYHWSTILSRKDETCYE